MKRVIGLTIALLLTAFVIPSPATVLTNGSEELFFNANQAYKEGRFNEAIDGYLRLIESGHAGGQIHYNLGNAYFKTGRLGRAILEYERARLLIPRDADLNFNLAHARDQAKDVIPESGQFADMAFFWLKSFNLAELFWVFVLFNFLLWTTLVIRLFRKPEWLFYPLLIILTFWLISGLFFGVKWYQIDTDDRAVILQGEVNVLAGPDSGDTVLFRLHEGTIVRQERSEDGWKLLRLPDKKRGWVESKAVQLISGKAWRR